MDRGTTVKANKHLNRGPQNQIDQKRDIHAEAAGLALKTVREAREETSEKTLKQRLAILEGV